MPVINVEINYMTINKSSATSIGELVRLLYGLEISAIKLAFADFIGERRNRGFKFISV